MIRMISAALGIGSMITSCRMANGSKNEYTLEELHEMYRNAGMKPESGGYYDPIVAKLWDMHLDHNLQSEHGHENLIKHIKEELKKLMNDKALITRLEAERLYGIISGIPIKGYPEY